MDHVELEYDAPNNGDFHFRPAVGKTIRGRFDVHRLSDAGPLKRRFPIAIPSQRLCMDDKGQCYIREPLYEPQYAELRREIEKSSRLEPERQPIPTDPATFVYWTREAVKSGKLKVVTGKLPDKVSGEPQKYFRFPPEPSEIQSLTNEFRRLGDLLEKALKK